MQLSREVLQPGTGNVSTNQVLVKPALTVGTAMGVGMGTGVGTYANRKENTA